MPNEVPAPAMFKDGNGREWTVKVTVLAIERVKQFAGVDLFDIVNGKALDVIFSNPLGLSQIIFAVVRPEAEKRQIDWEDFAESMAGECIDDAAAALVEAIASFSPSPKDRNNFLAVVSRTKSAMDKARDRATAKIEAGEIESAIESAMSQPRHTESPTSSPGSSA